MHFLNALPLALGASAFLIPAEIHEAVEFTNKLPSSTNKMDTIHLECQGGCPMAMEKTTTGDEAVKNRVPQFWSMLQPTRLEADIRVDGDKVLFNGQQIWPKTVSPPLSIKQEVQKETTYKPFSGLLPMSTSLEYKPDQILFDSDNHITIHPISIEILSLVDQVVHAESAEIRVVDTEAGLGLLPTLIKPYEASPYTDKCTTVWCRVKGTIAKKFNEFRQAAASKVKGWRGGCRGSKGGFGRKPGHTVNGLHLKGGPAKFGPGSTLHPHGPHGHHGHHRHHRSGFGAMVVAFTRAIIIPAFVGAFIGLIIGSLFWVVVNQFRKMLAPATEYIVVEQFEAEEGRADPPEYDEIYREPQEETMDEKKELLQ